MKIDNPLASQVSTGAASQSSGVNQTQTGSGGKSRLDGYSDRVQLSNLSSALRGLAVEDPQRAAEVQQIGALVQGGNYSIDPQQLSQKIIGESMAVA